MKKTLITLAAMVISLSSLAQITMAEADKMMKDKKKYVACYEALEKALPQAKGAAAQAEIYWRMAKASLLEGELQASKEEKRNYFKRGIECAEKGIAADNTSHMSYMWHCGNLGRDCQTRSMGDQMSTLPKMMTDLETILDKLGRIDCYEAWQALAEIYFAHPFKSNDAAVGFTRKAVTCATKVSEEMYLYAFFSQLLYSRNWSASKRASDIEKKGAKFAGNFKSNIERHEYFEGSLGKAFVPEWSKKSLGEMSDREEAVAIAEYAIATYEKSSDKTEANDEVYKKMKELLVKYK